MTGIPKDGKGQRKSMHDWYTTFFEGPYMRFFAPLVGPEQTRIQVEAIRHWLHLEPGMQVLDLGCGQGRHAIPLAAAGMAVTGQDLSPHMLGLARQAADDAGATVDWRQADMRELPDDGRFDAVLSLFSAFGYFAEDEDNVAVLKAIARTLKPGGRLLLDLQNREAAILQGTWQRDWEPQDDGSVMLEERRFDLLSGRIHIRLTRILGSEQETSDQWLRLYTLPELVGLLRLVGLAATGIWGDWDGRDYSLDAPRLILRVVKPLPEDL
jgi:SAM-dependent methyltransferase